MIPGTSLSDSCPRNRGITRANLTKVTQPVSSTTETPEPCNAGQVDHRKAQPTPSWLLVAVFISKGSYSPGLSWAAERQHLQTFYQTRVPEAKTLRCRGLPQREGLFTRKTGREWNGRMNLESASLKARYLCHKEGKSSEVGGSQETWLEKGAVIVLLRRRNEAPGVRTFWGRSFQPP